jgi:UDP-glucuronate 4-epimerase
MQQIFEEAEAKGAPVTHICHLAARAGVRYSIQNPDVYIHSNIQGREHRPRLPRRPLVVDRL